MTEAGRHHPGEPPDQPERSGEGDDDPGHAARPAAPGWPPLIVLMVLAAGLIVIVWLWRIGEHRGAWLVAVLGLGLAFVATMTPLMTTYLRVPGPFGGWPGRQKLFVLVVAAVTVTTISLIPLLVRPDVPISIPGSIRVEGRDELTPTSPATIVFLEPTPDRQYLGLQLYLDDYVGSGDCTTFAELTLTPLKGGRVGKAVQVSGPGTATRAPEQVAIPIEGIVQDLKIRVALQTVAGCTLGLEVREAVFYG